MSELFALEQVGRTGKFWNFSTNDFCKLSNDCLVGFEQLPPVTPEGVNVVEANSYKAAFFGCRETKYSLNGLAFETHEEASLYGKDLFNRWFGADDWCVIVSPENPTHKIENGEMTSL